MLLFGSKFKVKAQLIYSRTTGKAPVQSGRKAGGNSEKLILRTQQLLTQSPARETPMHIKPCRIRDPHRHEFQRSRTTHLTKQYATNRC